MISVKRFLKSFQHALRGLVYALRHEQNFKLQLIISLVILFLMFYFPLRVSERGILVLVIIIVLILELINTILERLSDILKPRIHFYVREIKDIMAATVLISSLGAILLGIIIFLPYLKSWLAKF